MYPQLFAKNMQPTQTFRAVQDAHHHVARKVGMIVAVFVATSLSPFSIEYISTPRSLACSRGLTHKHQWPSYGRQTDSPGCSSISLAGTRFDARRNGCKVSGAVAPR